MAPNNHEEVSLTGEKIVKVDEIHEAAKEYEIREQREKERHEKAMEEIEEQREAHMEGLRDDYDLDEIVDAFDSARSRAGTIYDLQREIKKMVTEEITDVLSGSYESHITVKNGSVHKYRKQRNSQRDFTSLLYGKNRDVIERALYEETSDDRAEAICAAMDRAKEIRSAFKSTDGSLTVESPLDEFDEMRVSVVTNSRRRKDYYVRFEADGSLSSRERFGPETTDPDGVAYLARAREDIIEVVDAIEGEYDERVEVLSDARNDITEILA